METSHLTQTSTAFAGAIVQDPPVITVTTSIPAIAAAAASLETDLRITAVHEAAHTVVAAVLAASYPRCDQAAPGAGLRPRAVDLDIRHGGETALSFGCMSIAESRVEREVRDQICVAMAGVEAERLFFGQGTTGGADDLRAATSFALELIDSGLDRSAPLLARGVFLANELPDAYLTRLLDAVERTIRTQSERSAALVSEWRPSILVVAERLLQAGRLSGVPLDQALEAAGVHWRTIADVAA